MNNICVYTCITGNYDDLKEIDNIEEGIDYYCFTNNKNINSNTWKVIYIKDESLSNIQLARKIKILGHPLINKKYDIFLWMDGAVSFSKNINDFIKCYLEDDDVFVAFKHNSRNSIFEECNACVDVKKENKKNVNKLLKFYEQEGYLDNNGLIESTVYIKRQKNSIVLKTMQLWFDMILNFSTRDQLSFNYCIYKTGLRVKWINENVFNNDWFSWKKHNNVFNNMYKVYYDFGDGFSEKNSEEIKYNTKSNKKKISIKIPKNVKNIRLDPTDKAFMYMRNFRVDNDVNIIYNRMIKNGMQYLFFDDDPSIIFDGFEKDNINISFELYEYDDKAYESLINKLYKENLKLKEKLDAEVNQRQCCEEDLNKIYNSKSWKITKPMRIILNKLKKAGE